MSEFHLQSVDIDVYPAAFRSAIYPKSKMTTEISVTDQAIISDNYDNRCFYLISGASGSADNQVEAYLSEEVLASSESNVYVDIANLSEDNRDVIIKISGYTFKFSVANLRSTLIQNTGSGTVSLTKQNQAKSIKDPTADMTHVEKTFYEPDDIDSVNLFNLVKDGESLTDISDLIYKENGINKVDLSKVTSKKLYAYIQTRIVNSTVGPVLSSYQKDELSVIDDETQISLDHAEPTGNNELTDYFKGLTFIIADDDTGLDGNTNISGYVDLGDVINWVVGSNIEPENVLTISSTNIRDRYSKNSISQDFRSQGIHADKLYLTKSDKVDDELKTVDQFSISGKYTSGSDSRSEIKITDIDKTATIAFRKNKVSIENGSSKLHNSGKINNTGDIENHGSIKTSVDSKLNNIGSGQLINSGYFENSGDGNTTGYLYNDKVLKNKGTINNGQNFEGTRENENALITNLGTITNVGTIRVEDKSSIYLLDEVNEDNSYGDCSINITAGEGTESETSLRLKPGTKITFSGNGDMSNAGKLYNDGSIKVGTDGVLALNAELDVEYHDENTSDGGNGAFIAVSKKGLETYPIIGINSSENNESDASAEILYADGRLCLPNNKSTYNINDYAADNKSCSKKYVWIKSKEDASSKVDNEWAALVDLIYPIGSIYMSTSETNPGLLFGGVWKSFAEGRTIIGVGSDKDELGNTYTFSANKNAGRYSHKLIASELPSHSHTTEAAGDHNHDGSSIIEAPDHIHHGIAGIKLGEKIIGDGTHYHDVTVAYSKNHTHTITARLTKAGTGDWTGFNGQAGNTVAGELKEDTPILDGSGRTAITIGDAGSHRHIAKTGEFAATDTELKNPLVADGSHIHNLVIEEGGKHSHGLSISMESTHTHEITADESIQNDSFSLLQPYSTCYIWQRIS